MKLPSGQQSAQKRQQKSPRHGYDSYRKDGINHRIQNHGTYQSAPVIGRIIARKRVATRHKRESAQPSLRQMAFQISVARLSGAYHIGCEEGRNHRHGHDNGIEEVADYAERETQRGYDKGELANLSH